MNNTRLQAMPTLNLPPAAMDAENAYDSPLIQYDTLILEDDVWKLPVGDSPRGVDAKAFERAMPIPFVLDDEEEVFLEEVVHGEIDYKLKAAVDMLLAEDGNGTKRKAKKHVVLIDTDEEDLFDPSDEEGEAEPKPVRVLIDTDEEEAEVAVVVEPKAKGGKQTPRWCFTYNNPVIAGVDFEKFLLGKKEIKGFVFQKEVGEQGTPHFQGYFELEKKKTTGGVHILLHPHRMKLLYANGTKAQNVKYCTKAEGRTEGPWISGVCKETAGQGKRNDIDEFAMLVKKNGGIDEEVEDTFHGHAMRFRKHAEQMVTADRLRKKKAEELAYWKEQYRREQAGESFQGQQQRELVLLFGPTAVGKTTHVKKEVAGRFDEMPFEKEGNTKWFDGYNGENHILFDEMRKEAFGGRLEGFNAMTNKGVTQVEVKGGTVVLECDYMWFTSNWHPTDVWGVKPENAAYRAFVRRFAEVHWWNDAKNKMVLKNPGAQKDTDEWREANKNWWSFWTGRNIPIEEGMSAVPGEAVDYFTFGCNQ